VPVNKSARAARVEDSALSPDWRLELVRSGAVLASLSYDDLRAMPQHTVDLPIACVEGWSAQGTWSGVRVRDLVRLVATAQSDVVVTSLQPSGPYRHTVLPRNFADDERTLVALDLSGEPLSLDHGFPCRLIAPDRPGVLQTKWLSRLEVDA
jgi:DMSO/TMAO reductase YedYZ molybdopterin-dependent catalytic subunit